jgi:hypothetical protein
MTLALFWARYLRRHELVGSVAHSLLLAIAASSAVLFYALAGATLRGEKPKPFRWLATWHDCRAWKVVSISTALLSLLVLVSVGAIYGIRWGERGHDWWPAKGDVRSPSIWGTYPRGWVPAAMRLFGWSPFADLSGADLSANPPSGKDSGGKASTIQGPRLDGINLRFADLRGTTLSGTVLAGAQLEWTDLLASHLSSSDLEGAHLEYSDLLGSDLRAANMTGAHLNGADLSQADLTSAELQFADFQGALGINGDMLTKAHNWCNAFYDPGVNSLLRLPADNADRIRKWRAYGEKLVQAYPTEAETARVEHVSRLFPNMNPETSALLGRLNDSTLGLSGANAQEMGLEVASIPWPANEAPRPAPIEPRPDLGAELPTADYLVITWTAVESAALARVLSPGYDWNHWYEYTHLFPTKFLPRLSVESGANRNKRLGSYFPIVIAGKKVLLFKSELHFSIDRGDVLEELLQQMMQETKAKIVITTGTAGSIGRGLQIGDVVIATKALLHCSKCLDDDELYSSDLLIQDATFRSANEQLFEANAFQAISAFETQNAILGRGLQRVILGCLVHKSLSICRKQVFSTNRLEVMHRSAPIFTGLFMLLVLKTAIMEAFTGTYAPFRTQRWPDFFMFRRKTGTSGGSTVTYAPCPILGHINDRFKAVFDAAESSIQAALPQG